MKAAKYTRETILEFGMKNRNFPRFTIGDTIVVGQRIKEENKDGVMKERIQLFKGDVIALHNKGISTTFTIRKIGAGNVPVERIFPYYSPIISSIELSREGDVRRAKLYYIRGRVGKSARIKERVRTKEEKEQRALSQQTR